MTTLGNRIAQLRRDKDLTQEELASAMGVSAQAVSKWENDVSCPDIMLLPKLAAMLGTSVDDLLSDKPKQATRFIENPDKKSIDEMILKIKIKSADGDKLNVNLPVPLVRMGLEIGLNMPKFEGNKALKDIDMQKIMLMIDSGVVGKLVDIESADGDIVEIVVE